MQALDRLKSLRQRVSTSNVEGGARKEYLAMVDRVINNIDAYIKQTKLQSISNFATSRSRKIWLLVQPTKPKLVLKSNAWWTNTTS